MPMYEYQCGGCREIFEVIQKFSDDPLTTCESCGGTLSKLLSAPSFHLTGGGWYADGYADAKPGTSGGQAASKGGGDSSTSGDTKKGASGSKDKAKSTTPATPSKGGTSGGE